MDRLQKTYPLVIQWRSYELRPHDGPPIPAAYRARIEASRPQLYATAREQYGLELNAGPFGIDSRPALLGAKYAELNGVSLAYHDAVLQAYWLHARDISDINELVAIAQSLGLDGEQFRTALDQPELTALVDEDIAVAQELGLTGVPAMVFGHKYLVMGAQPYPILEQVVQRVLSEAASAPQQ